MGGTAEEFREEQEKRKKVLSKSKIKIILAALAIILSILLTVGNGSDILPGWNDLYKAAGISAVSASLEPEIHFIDVGQGDSILIRDGDSAVLIDSGTNKDDGQALLSYLKKQGVRSFDYLVATHPHSDHIGGMDLVVENFPVDRMIMSDIMPDSEEDILVYDQLMTAIDKNNVSKETPRKNDIIYAGSVKLEILFFGQDNQDENETSIIIKATCKDSSFLFMGDAGIPVEKAMIDEGIDLKSDVLKLGHHGSKTASGDEFLQAVTPGYAIACCGKNNMYNHPAKAVTDRIKEHGIKMFRTDVNGTVLFTVKDSGLIVSSEY